MKLDATDLRILAELQADGSLSNVELARRVHLSPSPCLARVKALEAGGRHRTLRCDHESAGPGPDPERIHFHQPENAVEGSAGRVRKPHCGTGRGDGVLPDDG